MPLTKPTRTDGSPSVRCARPTDGGTRYWHARQSSQNSGIHSKVLKESISPKCRAFDISEETIVHILNMCQRSLFSLIGERHDEIVRCVARRLIHSGRTQVPRNIKNGMAYRLSESATVIIDRPIPTIDEGRENRPEIVVVEMSRILIIEIAVAWKTIVTNREREKFCNYQDLAADLDR